MRAHPVTLPPDPKAALRERPDFVDLLPVAVYACDADGCLRWFNNRAAELWGRSPRIGEPLQPHEVATEHVQPIGDASGRLLGTIGCLHNAGALHREAEPLLAELNHRIKNNMQMLHALLRGAQRETASVEAKAVLADAERRVGAIAAAQQVLYDAHDAESFGIADFMSVLCRNAQQSFGRRVNLRLATVDGTLRNDAAMPLALILNETIALLLDHSETKGPLGIDVALTREDGRLRLTVAGGQADIASRGAQLAASGPGLVNGLAAQLGGTFRVAQDDQVPCRTCCIVEIPASRAGH
ncbi:MAG: sensor histidine kinase [Alphaproteobacteria bacterium]|nr:sensor histidine kinase [Alphaproteobacteria bacterium]